MSRMIDFDTLYKEWKDIDNTHECLDCPLKELSSGDSMLDCFAQFLKSKNLTAPNQVEIPVKRTWTLKKEYVEFSNDFKAVTDKSFESSCDPVEKLKKYYDKHEEPDYSKIPVGAVVGVFTDLSRNPNYGIVQKNGDCILSITGNIDNINTFHISYSHIKSLEILKMPEAK